MRLVPRIHNQQTLMRDRESNVMLDFVGWPLAREKSLDAKMFRGKCEFGGISISFQNEHGVLEHRNPDTILWSNNLPIVRGDVDERALPAVLHSHGLATRPAEPPAGARW
jgi:hypothetical protein